MLTGIKVLSGPISGTISITSGSTVTTGTVVTDVTNAYAYACIVNYTNLSPPAKTGAATTVVDTLTGIVTISAHLFYTGMPIKVTSTTSVPSPLVSGTVYYIIAVSSSTFRFATSLANANAGTYIPLTTQGVGTLTFTPAILIQTFATTDVDTSADTITITGNGYLTGVLGRFTTTGTLPAGLSLATNYFMIKVDSNTFRVATSYANAIAGVYIDLTTQGSGTHTLTLTTFGTFTTILQSSADGVNWVNRTSGTTTFTSNPFPVAHEITVCRWVYFRIAASLTAGQVSGTSVSITKGHA